MRYQWVAVVAVALTIGVSAAKASAPQRSHGARTTAQLLQPIVLSFANARDGWVVASAGQKHAELRTVNGGHTWTRQALPFGVTQMQFINARRGWAIVSVPQGCVGPHPPCHTGIAYTVTGGRTWVWTHHAPSCWQTSSLDFANARDGWAVEGNWECLTRPSQRAVTCVIRTVDGGRSWHVVLSVPVASGSVHFGSQTQGWFAVSSEGSIHCAASVFHTVDGGQTWTHQFTVPHYCDASVDFVDARHGWLLATNRGMCSMGGCYDNRLYHMVDGGQHWRVEQRARLPSVPALWSGPSGFLGSVLFVTPQVGYIPVSEGAGPGQGGIDITHDAGQHWLRREPHRLQVSSVSAIDARTAWAIGEVQPGCATGIRCSFVLYTGDGGREWRIVRTAALKPG